MAILLTGQYNNRKGDVYILRVYDDQLGADSSDEFQVTTRLSWQWSGETKNIYQGIRALSLQFGMNVPASGPVRTFVNAFLVETNERRYWLKVLRNGQDFARGWLAVDQSEKPIRSRDDFPFTLYATDSLAILNNFDYIDPATPDTPFEGSDSVKDHAIKVLQSAKLDDLYLAGETFLSISVEYHNSLMATTTEDYATTTKIDHRKFGAVVEEEVAEIPFLEPTVVGEKVVQPGKAGDVLERLCFMNNATFFHCDGQYYLMSRSQLLDGATVPVFNYDKNGGSLGSGTVSRAVTIGSPTSNPTGYYILSESGVETRQAPVKRVQIQHFLGGGNNKIIGHDWDIDYNDQECFDQINNADNATVQGSFPINMTIKTIGHTNNNLFRAVLGLKLKVGAQWLLRDIKTGLNVFNEIELLPQQQTIAHPDSIYEEPIWSGTEGYFKFVIDIAVKGGDPFYFNDFPQLQVYDIISPAIPASGQLCIDWDLVDLRAYNFVGVWPAVSFSDADTFTSGGDTYDVYWSVKDSYVNIQSDGSELNEDTLAYKQVNANVNPNNTEVLELTTEIGDDPSSNTHGRIQIDTGSGDEDADGGWTFNGAGTVYASHKEILAYDMARLRSGVVRVMRATITSDSALLTPYSRITFDGSVFMMGSTNNSSDAEDYQGEWYSLDDSNAGAITLDDKVFKSVGSNGSANTASSSGGGGGYTPPPEYYFLENGNGTDRLQVAADTPLPNAEINSEPQMNSIFKKALKGSGNMIYRETLTHPTHFKINNATNEIVFFRPMDSDDEFFFNWVGTLL